MHISFILLYIQLKTLVLAYNINYIKVLTIFILKLFIFWNLYIRRSNPDVMIEIGIENKNVSWVINEKALTGAKCRVNVCELCQ